MKTGKKILTQPFLPWLVLGVLTLVWHLGLVIVDGDEVFYGSVLGQQPLWEFLVQQYQGWSSRTVIEGFLCLFSTLPRWVWRLCDSAVIVGLALCLDRLVQGPAGETSLPAAARQKDRWVIACVLWLYPWWYLSTAGWVATTMNYLWPLAGLCLAMCSLAGYGGRTGRIAGLLGLVYAVNAEQSAVLAVFLLAGYGLFCLANRRPVPRLLWVQAAVTAAGLVYMLASPGVKARTQNEIASYYKDFAMQSFLAKAEAGISGALGELFLDRNLLYTLFLLLLAAAVWQRTAHIFYRLLVLVPLGVQLGLGVFFRHYKDRVPALRDAVEAARGVGTIHVANCNQPTAYLPFLLMCGCFAIVCGCLYLALGHTARAYGALVVFFGGFCTRAAIGFTPASAVSGERTGFLFAMAAGVCAVLLARQITLRRLWQKVLAAVILLPMVGIQFVSLWEI